jgi:hypothetical protein
MTKYIRIKIRRGKFFLLSERFDEVEKAAGPPMPKVSFVECKSLQQFKLDFTKVKKGEGWKKLKQDFPEVCRTFRRKKHDAYLAAKEKS